MKPHLVRWHKEFAGKGLVVLDINDGKADTQDELKAEVAKAALKFPVLWDSGAKNIANYGVEAFPSAFLVGVDGKVIWEGVPNAKVKEIEKLIAQELDKIKK